MVHVEAAETVGDRLAAVVEHIPDDHPGTLGGEVPGVRLAHAARTTGDQSDLAVESSHPSLPTQNQALARERNTVSAR
ncbi:hypothetical protein Adu01nite_82580 [Paractinoplanes durhamensis]|uniref:Uncharacterized protein n=1 Tax=Paractinoplanes durhamensis TaxID=113563 RepID=A0ABQ3ZAP7_9ACTN|nr:hypothetical protein Adu01nite_82580 [Actinoplanes durhamensis]